MGMTRSSMELQIQQATQQAITKLTQDMGHLDGALRSIDMNMRGSHMALYTDITQLRLRVNFLLDELKKSKDEAGIAALEEQFKEYMKAESSKMQKQVADAVAAREEAIDEKEPTQSVLE